MFKNDENVDNKIFIKNIEIGSEEKSLPFESELSSVLKGKNNSH